jgi:hypothetical protein
MEILRVDADAWGQELINGVSWDLLPVFFLAGIAGIVIHMIFMALRSRRR